MGVTFSLAPALTAAGLISLGTMVIYLLLGRCNQVQHSTASAL